MKRLLLTMAFAGAALCGAVAQAADVAVQPVRLNFSKGQDRQAITLTNRSAEDVVMQVEAVSWTQVDGRDEHAATEALVVNPPLFTIPPGRAQVVRVGLRGAAGQAERETAYRLLLREVPRAAAPASDPAAVDAVRVLLQLRLPVYVAPAQVQVDERWRAWRTAGGDIAVGLDNAGTVHTVVSELRLQAPGAADGAPPVAQTRANAAVLPGQSRTWHWPAGSLAPDAQRLQLDVTTAQGPRRVVLELERP